MALTTGRLCTNKDQRKNAIRFQVLCFPGQIWPWVFGGRVQYLLPIGALSDHKVSSTVPRVESSPSRSDNRVGGREGPCILRPPARPPASRACHSCVSCCFPSLSVSRSASCLPLSFNLSFPLFAGTACKCAIIPKRKGEHESPGAKNCQTRLPNLVPWRHNFEWV